MNSLNEDVGHHGHADQQASTGFLRKRFYSNYLSPYLLQFSSFFDVSSNCNKLGDHFTTCFDTLNNNVGLAFQLLIYTAIIAFLTVLAIFVAIKVVFHQLTIKMPKDTRENAHEDQTNNTEIYSNEMPPANFISNRTNAHCVERLKCNKFYDQFQAVFTKKKILFIVSFYWILESLFLVNNLVDNFNYCNFGSQFNNTASSRQKETMVNNNYNESSIFVYEVLLTYSIAFPYLFVCLIILSRNLFKFGPLILICLVFATLFVLCKIILLFIISFNSNSSMCNASMQRFIRSCVSVVAMSIGIAATPINMLSNNATFDGFHRSSEGGSLAERYYWKNAETETNKQRGRYPKENKPNAVDFSDNDASLKKDLSENLEVKSPRRLSSATKPNSDNFIPCVVLMPKNKSRQAFSHSTSTGMVIGTCVKFHSSNKMRRRFSLDTEHRRKNYEEDISNAYRNMKRRTSLPTSLLSSRKKIVMSSVLVESGTIAEINTVLRDLVALTHGTPEITQYVTKLQKLLKPYQTEHLRPSQVVWLHDSLSAATSDGSDDEEINRGVRQVFPKRPHRDWASRDKSLWTTTTSATGLPSKDPGPVKPIRLPISKTPNSTPRDSRCNSPICSSKDMCLPRRRTPMLSPGHASKQFFKPLESTGKDVNDNNSLKDISKLTLSDDSGCQDNNHTDSSECDVTINSHGNRTPPISHLVMHDNNTLLHTPSHLTDSLEMDPSHLKTSKLRMLVPTIDESCEDEEVMSHDDAPALKHNKHSDDVGSFDACSQGADSGRLSANLEHYHGECLFQTSKYHGTLLEQVPSWNFPIFSLADKTHCVLSQMAYKLFDDTGLFHIFKIPRHLFVNYMKVLENGYRNIPYHNRIHAADVLHGCWFLTTQQVHDFHERSHLFASESSDSDSGTSTIQSERHQVNNIGHTSLATAIPALELMALYLAASMHDYDHPGRTNAFLVETRHPLAMLYNDRSVLENHHASASWELLHSRNDGAFDFLQNLKTAEWKRLRFLIVEAILATDLKKHFELMNKFMSRTTKPRTTSQSSEGSGSEESIINGINWSKDEDRLLVCQMVIKLADISGPTKSRNLHVTWTKAICEEFFTQGDEERKLEVPLSLYMDRNEPKVAALQRTFIKNLIDPLVKAMHNAGILAGRCDEDTEYESDSNANDVLGSSPGSTCVQPRNVILSQLSSNSRQWKLMEDRKLPGKEEMDSSFSTAHFVRLSHEGYPQLPILTADDDKFADIREREHQIAPPQKTDENRLHEDENDAEIASINLVNNNNVAEDIDHRNQKSSFTVVTSSLLKKPEDLNKNMTARSNRMFIPKAKNRHSELKSSEGAS